MAVPEVVEEIDETIRSRESNYAVSLIFENQTNKNVDLYWYNFAGEMEIYNFVAAGF